MMPTNINGQYGKGKYQVVLNYRSPKLPCNGGLRNLNRFPQPKFLTTLTNRLAGELLSTNIQHYYMELRSQVRVLEPRKHPQRTLMTNLTTSLQ